jgi:hypothetical protein
VLTLPGVASFQLPIRLILGGMATAGLVLHLQRWTIGERRIIGGLAWEMARRIAAMNDRFNAPGPWNLGWEGAGIPPFDPEHLLGDVAALLALF